MDRDVATDLFKAASAIEDLLGDIPHGTAVTIIKHLSTVRAYADGAFPGGYASECIYCSAHIGNDERVSVGDEACCTSCWQKHLDDMHKCEHALEADHDEFGEPIQHCPKCGYTEAVKVSEATTV